MATRTWSSSSSTDMNDSSNYSGSGALLTSDDLVFNNTSVVNATATGALDVASVTIASTYTGAWSLASYALTCEGTTGFADAGASGSRNYGSVGITLVSNTASITISSGARTVTATSATFTFNGTANTLTDGKGITIFAIVIGTGGNLTTNGASITNVTGSTGNRLTIGNNGKLTVSQNIYFFLTGTQTVFSIAGTHTINGAYGLYLFGNNTGTMYIPAVTISIQGNFYIEANTATTTFELTGDLTVSDNNCYCYLWGSGASSCTLNLKTFNLSVKSSFYMASSGGSSGIPILNCGSGTVSIGNLGSYSPTGKSATVDFSTSTWTVTNSGGINAFNLGENWTVSPGTATINITASQSLNFGGHSVYSLVLNKAGGTFTLASHIFCNSYTLTNGSITLSGFFIFQSSVDNVWSATGASTWNTASNWSLGHVPSAGENVIFNSTSTYACSVNVTPSITNMGIQVEYTGNITFATQSITCAGGFAQYGTGTMNYGNGVTINGAAAVFYIGSMVGTITATSATFTFNGTTSNAFTTSKSLTINRLVIGTSAIVTIGGTASTIFVISSTTSLTMGNASSLTNGLNLWFKPNASQTVFSFAGTYTLTGTGGIYVTATTAGTTTTIPATTSSMVYFELAPDANNTVYNLSGDLNLTGLEIFNYELFNINFTFNSNNYNITCNTLNVGNNYSNGSFTANFGSSTISCTSFPSTYNNATGNSTINFMNSKWTCSGNWVFGSNFVITHQIDSVTLTNTANITSNGKKFNYLILNASGKTVTMIDNLICHGYQKIAGTLSTNGKSLTVTGDYIEVTDTQ